MSIGITWTGWDGSVWDLAHGPYVRAMLTGIRGFGKPEAQDMVQSTPQDDGQTYQGSSLKPRAVFLPLKWARSAQRQVDTIQAQFWRSVQIGKYGVLRVTREDGSYRELRCRATDDSGYTLQSDPYIVSLPFGLNLVADRPWWEGPAVETQYLLGVSAGDDWLADDPASKGDYVLAITASSGSGAQVISNPGEQPAWPTWIVDQANATAVRFGVGSSYVGGPITVNGRTLYVESDPRRQVAYLDDLSSTSNRVTRQLTEAGFAPIPAGGAASISLAITGTGRVRGRFRPRYERAL